MELLKARFKAKADAENAEIKDLLKLHGDKKLVKLHWVRLIRVCVA